MVVKFKAQGENLRHYFYFVSWPWKYKVYEICRVICHIFNDETNEVHTQAVQVH